MSSSSNRGRGSAGRAVSAVGVGNATLLVLAEQPVESFLLADSKLSRLNSRVVDTEEGVNVVHGLRTDVRELLDLSCGILDL